ncbi:MAG: cyclic nucleotide-binding domain-containing protein [Bdellovibrio sp.]|nr:MAG: cyclic nucleotide-binding domain-containing protein [Bdellovibrio sp.]
MDSFFICYFNIWVSVMVNFLWDNFFRKGHKENSVISTLSQNYMFEVLSPKELKFMEQIVHVRNFRPGEVIFSQGELGVGMYIIMKGSVNIFVEDPYAADPSQKRTFITRLKQGDFFGEIALVEKNGRRTASATAVDDVTLIGFFKPDLYELIDRNPRTGVKILTRLSEVLGRRLKETSEKFSELKRELRQLKILKDKESSK